MNSPSQTLLSGVDTLAHLLAVRHQLDERKGLQTATLVSGYPGSPLGTFDLTIESRRELLDPHRVVHRPGLNEELAAATVWGSQMGAAVPYSGVDGVAGAWYGKGPGLDRSGDAMKHGNAMGAGPNGGVVMFCGDDPSAKSSTLACDSQYTFEDAAIPVLFPGDPQDILDLGVHAFYMSRYSGAWVGLKVVTAVADGIGTVDLDLDRHHPDDPTDVVIDGQPWHHQPLRTVGAHPVPNQETLILQRLDAAKAYARHNGINRVFGAGPGARLGIVCAGKTYFDVVQAFADLGVQLDDLEGLGVRVLKLGMTFPLVEDTVVDFAESVEQLVVIEEKRPFVETQLRSVLHQFGNTVPVLGKRDRAGVVLTTAVGELDATSVGAIITRVLPELSRPKPQPRRSLSLPLVPLPARPPGFCSGCPHNRSTVAPDDALVGGGVGCHGIMYFEARNVGMRTMPPTPMGAEGVPWLGLAPFVDEPHLIQNLGDGTLSHSGTLAIRAAVGAGVDMTFKILYNRAVAMTGGQDVMGLMDVPNMTRALEAEGVSKIVVCAVEPKRYGRRAKWARGVKVLGRDHLDQVQNELQHVPGVSVIIYDQQCAAEARRLRSKGLQPTPPRRVYINEYVCEGCGDCSAKSNCLSVLPQPTEFGDKRQIHDPSCNRDYTCLEGDCPSFVTITPRRVRGRAKSREAAKPKATPQRHRPALPVGTLPSPALPTVDSAYGVYFTGIGGTGVVTANRIIAEAAKAAGLLVGGMDQTGLSQKAGAVVSHLHLAVDRNALGAATVSAGGADLYLSGDILQAAGEKHLDKVRPGRSVAVIDEDFTPTAGMLQTAAAPPDVETLKAEIRDRVGAERTVFVDSTRIAETVFANHLQGNIILLGAAYQMGGLPYSLDHIEAAMRGGRAAADNREAFEWGRWVVHDPAAVEKALATAADGTGTATHSIFDPSAAAASSAASLVTERPLPPNLRPLLIRRAAQVIDYQNDALAKRWLDLVQLASERDDAEHDWALTRAVAEAWHKLLTYKDEYDVARMHLAVDYDKVAQDYGIDGPYKVTYHLHPPTLRRLGLKRKLPMGKPYELAFRALRHMKGLRGTPFDIFGYDPDRRLERALIDEYEHLVRGMGGQPYDTQVRIAESVQEIKGYAEVKDLAVARWREHLAEIQAATPTEVRT